MKNLDDILTKELIAELNKRKDKPPIDFGYCFSCNKYKAYMGASRGWNNELHCEGCRRPVIHCTCSRI